VQTIKPRISNNIGNFKTILAGASRSGLRWHEHSQRGLPTPGTEDLHQTQSALPAAEASAAKSSRAAPRGSTAKLARTDARIAGVGAKAARESWHRSAQRSQFQVFAAGANWHDLCFTYHQCHGIARGTASHLVGTRVPAGVD
jgi:hypothetical protein